MDQGGIRLGLLSLDQRRILHRMLGEVLSEEGYLRLHAIRWLENVLKQHDVIAGLARDPDAYTLQFFGAPLDEEPWAIKLEGHHLSLNATVVDNSLRATPLFLGSSPAEVRAGPSAGLRVLGAPEDLARALIATFSSEQRSYALGEVGGRPTHLI